MEYNHPGQVLQIVKVMITKFAAFIQQVFVGYAEAVWNNHHTVVLPIMDFR